MIKNYLEPVTHTQVPVNVGTTVMALKYAGGVIIAADTAVAYGSMKKTKHAQRVYKLSEESAMASSGEMSDF